MQIYINRKSGHIYCSVVDNLLTCVVWMYYAMTNDRWLVDDRGCMVVAHVWKIVITAAVTTQHHQLSWMAFCFASIKLYIVSPTKIWRYSMSHENMVNFISHIFVRFKTQFAIVDISNVIHLLRHLQCIQYTDICDTDICDKYLVPQFV